MSGEMTPLTIENARVGMRVHCVDGFFHIIDDGEDYVISSVHTEVRTIRVAGVEYAWNMTRFVICDPTSPPLMDVLSERAPPSQEPPGVTNVRAQIREGWWV